MSEPRVCPECGTLVPADAPAALCPRCLLGAAAAQTAAIHDRVTECGPSPIEHDAVAPATPVELDQFKRAVLELGLIPAAELEPFVAGAVGDVHGLARALVVAGKLTPYQVGALTQGKARGLVIGNYFILDKLGAGGMGVVFKTRHRRLGRIVALKILPPSLARDRRLVARFRREVEVAAKLSHPNIVSVLDADEDRGVQFMTMEYIKGNDLDHLVRDGGALPVDLALDCTIQAARGLEAAHAQGIVHRDIKPGNLMLDESAVVRVLDLGLARLVEASNPFAASGSGALTQSGTCMGTVDFMAPEQGVDARRVDHRADIYSLGCTLCYLLTGRTPFEGANFLARLVAHQERSPVSLSALRPEVPEAIDAVYEKMMAKNPADRPASMTAVVALLEACRSPSAEPETLRSGLKTFAATVILKRAAPQGTIRDTLVCQRDDPATLEVNPDLKLEDVLLDRGVPHAPAAPRVPVEPAAHPKRVPLARPHRPRKRRSHALVLGSVALLAVGGLVASHATRSGPNAPAERANLAATTDSTQGEPVAADAPAGSPTPVAPTPITATSPTFDVATFYSTKDLEVRSIAVEANGRRALIGGVSEFAVYLDVAKHAPAPLQHSLDWQGSAINHVALSPDGRVALIGTAGLTQTNTRRLKAASGGIVWCFDMTTGRPLFPRQQPYQGPVTAVALSADGRRGLSASRAGELTVWDLAAGQAVRRLGPQPGEIAPNALAVFPDGRRAATGGSDRNVHVWDLDAGREVAAWTGHDGAISGLAVSADGRRIATGSDDGTVILWDAGRGAILHRFTTPGDKGARVVFDHDGNLVAAGNGAAGKPPRPGRLVVWHAESYATLRQDETPFVRHLAVAALPGGRVLTADHYGVRLWTPRPPGVGSDGPSPEAYRGTAPVDLIETARTQPQTFRRREWQFANGALLSPATGGARLQFPTVPPAEYRLDIEAERVGKETDYGFGLGLVIGGRQAEINVDKKVDKGGEKLTGLDGLDGIPVQFQEVVHHGTLLLPSRPARFTLTVRRAAVALTCDGISVIDWKGDPKRFVPNLRWDVPDTKRLFLAASSPIRFHKITLTPLTAPSP